MGEQEKMGEGGWKPLRQSFLAEQWSLCAFVCVCVRGCLCVIFVISYGRGLYPMLGLGQ